MAAGLPSDNHDPALQKIADPRSARYSDPSFFGNGGRERLGTIRPGSTISNDLGQSCLHNLTQRVAPEGHHKLALQLLAELEFPSEFPGEGADAALADLNTVLVADYHNGSGFPPVELAQELGRITDHFIKPYGQIWSCWQDRHRSEQLRRVFHWGDVVVSAAPYLEGGGRALWGFSAEKRVQGRRTTVIFLNTAHEPGAVATTIGHELGHHVYQTVLGKCGDQVTIGKTFPQHLSDEHELFSDAVVALSAYSRSATRAILGDEDGARRLRKAIAMIDSQYRIDLEGDKLSALWRLRYLTLTIHLFKLRCALFEEAGI